MKKRKTVALTLFIIGLTLSVAFIMKVEFPQSFTAYFKKEYYNQFGPLVISIELLIASYYLCMGHNKTNFTLALFGFTALLDPFFNQIGVFNSIVPLYGTIISSICALFCLWLAFSNVYKLKRLSYLVAMISLILGVFVELFFNNF